jgi:hypothetical protein
MNDYSLKDYFHSKNVGTSNVAGDEINELMRLKKEYQENPSTAKRFLMEAKQKKLAKKGLRIKI